MALLSSGEIYLYSPLGAPYVMVRGEKNQFLALIKSSIDDFKLMY